MKRAIKYTLAVAGATAVCGIVAATALADNRDDVGNPFKRILALLEDRTFGLAEIRHQVGAIEGRLAAPKSVRLSSGPFGLPANAISVDWELLNDSSSTQTVTVTVFQVGIGLKTVVAPGPLTLTIAPGEATHNANSVGPSQPFAHGFDYEVLVEASSLNVLPRAVVWEDLGNTQIAGTLIPSGAWVRLANEQGPSQ